MKNKKPPCQLLFEREDELYALIKNEREAWHAPAKKYWQNQFETYQRYLDTDFSIKLKLEFHSRLWEVTLN